ncbi:MAG: transglycosylase domain-containing protein [Desulfurivibrio sp.]|nr:transglycosylase domain-containing protein [Desulfurivibrio sp.]
MIGLAAAYTWLVVLNPGEVVRRENIERILARESPVYYRDGVSRLGVFFEQAHRQYVPFARIPTDFVHAIVAAEDSSFFDHYGIDFAGVLRAAIANIKAGRVVQGGSTITQQTAKNLFKRRDRSLVAKLKELLYALRLEYHYEKEDILEFYTNQFFVSGNGRGLGMAARYFFDKPVQELTLLECAFIAGSVKGPNNYNPFVKRDEEAAQRARRLARQRAAYVLEQMHRLDFIDRQRLRQQRGREIPFRQGRMGYHSNTLLDLVREGLSEPEVVEALSRHGIDNVATSGISIITAIDKKLQQEAHYALRRELSRLDIRLRGYDHRAMQEVYGELGRTGEPALPPSPFLLGEITEIVADGSSPAVRVALGASRDGGAERSDDAVSGVLDRQGLFNLLTPLARYRQHAWSAADDDDLAALLAELEVGDLVYVSVRGQRDGQWLLELEKYPELQGGVLALQEGAIRAMVGGRDNRNFNRAITARRPMGSVMKPLLYAAALQLGWNSADRLTNRRDLFTYQDQAYFPRPYHEIKHQEVSLSWAGVLSENVASVWLLYHLTDHLAPGRFAELVEQLGFARRSAESMGAYTRRIRDQHGVVVDQDALGQIAFARAVEQVGPDLLFDGREREYELLQELHYGAGFARYRDRVAVELFGPGAAAADRREGERRLAILERNFLDYRQKGEQLRALRLRLAGESLPAEAPLPLYYNDRDKLVYVAGPWPEGRQALRAGQLRELLPAGTAAGGVFGGISWWRVSCLWPP